jgi:hypothetical protein
MDLHELLSERKIVILEKWFDAALDSYHQDTADFLKRQKDQFDNPVGSIIYDGLNSLFDEILNGADRDKVSKSLDNIIRIRAVQDFAPSQAIAFIGQLKIIVREEINSKNQVANFAEELFVFDRMVDNIMLLSFDIYMKCREKIYDIKANELRNMTSKLVERANKIFEAKYRKTDFEKPCLQGNKIERGD